MRDLEPVFLVGGMTIFFFRKRGDINGDLLELRGKNPHNKGRKSKLKKVRVEGEKCRGDADVP